MTCLDLAHSRSTADTTGARTAGATGTETRHDSRDSESSKREPKECSAGLSLTASLARAPGDGVAVDVVAVAAAVDMEVGRRRNTSNQGEDGVEDVEDKWEHRVDGEAVLDGRRDEVEEREHGEDGHEHVVVDDRRPAGDGDHVADEGHAEEDPEELCAGVSVTFSLIFAGGARAPR